MGLQLTPLSFARLRAGFRFWGESVCRHFSTDFSGSLVRRPTHAQRKEEEEVSAFKPPSSASVIQFQVLHFPLLQCAFSLSLALQSVWIIATAAVSSWHRERAKSNVRKSPPLSHTQNTNCELGWKLSLINNKAFPPLPSTRVPLFSYGPFCLAFFVCNSRKKFFFSSSPPPGQAKLKCSFFFLSFSCAKAEQARPRYKLVSTTLVSSSPCILSYSKRGKNA